jgi:hypothetical protein
VGWSKQDLIRRAFGKIGLSSSVFELSAEQMSEALQDLDTMMADWNGRGIRLGYPIPSTAGGSKPEDDSCLPDWALRAVILNLGITLAEDVGKSVSQLLAAAAKRSYDMLLARSVLPPEQQMPSGMPAGAGNRRGRFPSRPFLDGPTDNLEVGPDGDLDF